MRQSAVLDLSRLFLGEFEPWEWWWLFLVFWNVGSLSFFSMVSRKSASRIRVKQPSNLSLSLWNLCKLWNMSHEASQLNYLACGRFCKVPQNPSLFLQQRRSSSSSSSDQTNSIIVRWAAGVFLCVSVCMNVGDSKSFYFILFFFHKGLFCFAGLCKIFINLKPSYPSSLL